MHSGRSLAADANAPALHFYAKASYLILLKSYKLVTYRKRPEHTRSFEVSY